MHQSQTQINRSITSETHSVQQSIPVVANTRLSFVKDILGHINKKSGETLIQITRTPISHDRCNAFMCLLTERDSVGAIVIYLLLRLQLYCRALVYATRPSLKKSRKVVRWSIKRRTVPVCWARSPTQVLKIILFICYRLICLHPFPKTICYQVHICSYSYS